MTLDLYQIPAKIYSTDNNIILFSYATSLDIIKYLFFMKSGLIDSLMDFRNIKITIFLGRGDDFLYISQILWYNNKKTVHFPLFLNKQVN